MIYGKDRASNQYTIFIDQNAYLDHPNQNIPISLKGFVSPTTLKSSKKHLYVNSFHLASCELMVWINNLLKRKYSSKSAEHIDWVLFLEVDKRVVDMNVSYSKDAVIFQVCRFFSPN